MVIINGKRKTERGRYYEDCSESILAQHPKGFKTLFSFTFFFAIGRWGPAIPTPGTAELRGTERALELQLNSALW